jgi:cytochrome c5
VWRISQSGQIIFANAGHIDDNAERFSLSRFLENNVSEGHSEVFSIRNTIVLGALLLIAVFIGEVLIGPPSDEPPMVEVMDTLDDIAMRIQPVVSLEEMRNSMMSTSAAGGGASQTPEQMYQGACFACHGTGAAGAPKLGDAGAWSARLGKGVDELVSSAINGIGAMPPRGGSSFDDDQIRAVVEYILDQSK